MEDKKITMSLSTAIIIVLLIAILVVGLVLCYQNYTKVNDTEKVVSNEIVDQPIYNSTISNETIIESSNTINTNNTINNTTTNTNTTVDNSVTDSSNTVDTPSTPPSNSVEGIASSKQKPLKIGQWGIASKYASGDYVDVPVKVTKVTRGSSAAQEVKNYCNNGSSIYRYEDAKQGMEWAVIEYQVDLTKMEKESSIRMDTKITGTGNNTSIKYKDVIYIVSTMNMTSGYTKGEVVNCKFAVQLPIGCTDYLIALGSSSSTQAFFSGK